MKLDVKAFALTCATVCGLGLFCFTWWLIAIDGSSVEITFLGRLYRGYSITPGGSLVGMTWAFLDGLLGGAVFAWLYNFLASQKPKSHT